jgi:hypothetical protein
MIIHGHSSIETLNEKLFDNCVSCGKNNCLELSVNQNYATVFFIPFFPTHKTVNIFCNSCYKTIKLKEATESIRLHYKNIKSKARLPLWTFSGFLLLCSFIVLAYFVGTARHKNKIHRMSNVQVGDIFGVKLNDTLFTICKFDKIMNDTLFYRMSKLEAQSEEELSSLRLQDSSQFSNVENGISRENFIKAIDDLTLLEVK